MKNFSTNENSRQSESQLVHFSHIGIERGVDLMIRKLDCVSFEAGNRTKPASFYEKLLDQSEFEKKSNSIFRFLSHWNRERGWHWWLENSIMFSLIHVIGEKWLFFIKNFSTNQNSRKNQTQLFDFCFIGIERGVDTDD